MMSTYSFSLTVQAFPVSWPIFCLRSVMAIPLAKGDLMKAKTVDAGRLLDYLSGFRRLHLGCSLTRNICSLTRNICSLTRNICSLTWRRGIPRLFREVGWLWRQVTP